jgi:hypothetical protein
MDVMPLAPQFSAWRQSGVTQDDALRLEHSNIEKHERPVPSAAFRAGP